MSTLSNALVCDDDRHPAFEEDEIELIALGGLLGLSTSDAKNIVA